MVTFSPTVISRKGMVKPYSALSESDKNHEPPAHHKVVDTYVPKRSSRTNPEKQTQGDGDTWIEVAVIVKGGGAVEANTARTNGGESEESVGRTRSLFYSVKTQKAKWDEPPSGASEIILKSDDMPPISPSVMGAAIRAAKEMASTQATEEEAKLQEQQHRNKKKDKSKKSKSASKVSRRRSSISGKNTANTPIRESGSSSQEENCTRSPRRQSKSFEEAEHGEDSSSSPTSEDRLKISPSYERESKETKDRRGVISAVSKEKKQKGLRAPSPARPRFPSRGRAKQELSESKKSHTKQRSRSLNARAKSPSHPTRRFQSRGRAKQRKEDKEKENSMEAKGTAVPISSANTERRRSRSINKKDSKETKAHRFSSRGRAGHDSTAGDKKEDIPKRDTRASNSSDSRRRTRSLSTRRKPSEPKTPPSATARAATTPRSQETAKESGSSSKKKPRARSLSVTRAAKAPSANHGNHIKSLQSSPPGNSCSTRKNLAVTPNRKGPAFTDASIGVDGASSRHKSPRQSGNANALPVPRASPIVKENKRNSSETSRQPHLAKKCSSSIDTTRHKIVSPTEDEDPRCMKAGENSVVNGNGNVSAVRAVSSSLGGQLRRSSPIAQIRNDIAENEILHAVAVAVPTTTAQGSQNMELPHVGTAVAVPVVTPSPCRRQGWKKEEEILISPRRASNSLVHAKVRKEEEAEISVIPRQATKSLPTAKVIQQNLIVSAPVVASPPGVPSSKENSDGCPSSSLRIEKCEMVSKDCPALANKPQRGKHRRESLENMVIHTVPCEGHGRTDKKSSPETARSMNEKQIPNGTSRKKGSDSAKPPNRATSTEPQQDLHRKVPNVVIVAEANLDGFHKHGSKPSKSSSPMTSADSGSFNATHQRQRKEASDKRSRDKRSHQTVDPPNKDICLKASPRDVDNKHRKRRSRRTSTIAPPAKGQENGTESAAPCSQKTIRRSNVSIHALSSSTDGVTNQETIATLATSCQQNQRTQTNKGNSSSRDGQPVVRRSLHQQHRQIHSNGTKAGDDETELTHGRRVEHHRIRANTLVTSEATRARSHTQVRPLKGQKENLNESSEPSTRKVSQQYKERKVDFSGKQHQRPIPVDNNLLDKQYLKNIESGVNIHDATRETKLTRKFEKRTPQQTKFSDPPGRHKTKGGSPKGMSSDKKRNASARQREPRTKAREVQKCRRGSSATRPSNSCHQQELSCGEKRDVVASRNATRRRSKRSMDARELQLYNQACARISKLRDVKPFQMSGVYEPLGHT